MSASTIAIPGYTTGIWTINPLNSDVSFTVRHLGISRVHGRFNAVAGEIVTGPTLELSSVSATIDADSIDTGFPARDGFIKGNDVLATAEHKQLTFVSTDVREAGARYFIDGDLTIRGVTKSVLLSAQIGGFGDDPATGTTLIGIAATTTIERAEFGFGPDVPVGVIGERVRIQLDIQASRNV